MIIMKEQFYTSEKTSTEYIQINNCSRLYLGHRDHHNIRPHGRIDYLLMYISDGKCYIVVDGEEKIVNKGSVVIYRPGEPHDYRFRQADNPTNHWIHFTGSGCEDLFKKLGLENVYIVKLDHTSEIEYYFTRICEEFHRNNQNHDIICGGMLMALLGLIAQQNNEVRSVPVSAQQIDEIAGHIQTYPQEELDLDMCAAHCNVSKSRFIHLFKEMTGMPPHRYMTTVRMRRAKEMLLHTDHRISEIAEMIGYADQNYFTRVFKKYTGMLPSEYRKG